MLARLNDCFLVIMNPQEEILPLLKNGDRMIDDCCWLAGFASAMNIPTIIAIHENLGNVHKSILESTDNPIFTNVVAFSILQNEEAKQKIVDLKRKQVILIGCEAHISIYQSAIEFLDNGYDVFVISNSITARNDFDINMFKNRCLQLGIHLVSKEMIFCALVKSPTFPNFDELCQKFLGETVYC